MGLIRIGVSGFDTSSLQKWSKSSIRKANRNLKSAVQKIAFDILRDAKQRTPVRTGALRSSGRVIIIDSKNAEIEFGGGGTGVNYAAAVEYGAGGRSPKPYLRPAVKANEKNANRLLLKAIVDANK